MLLFFDHGWMKRSNCCRSTAIFYALRPLVLASASPRRISFLSQLGLPVKVLIPPQEAEPAPVPQEKPEAYVLRAALAKAHSALPLCGPDAGYSGAEARPVIIAADTIVALRSRILGKPQTPGEAFAMLRDLSGKSHTVITGCALLDGQAPRVFAVRSTVRMWDCPDALLRAYADSGEPADKAGAYAIQGLGACLVRGITGSWSNVVGLPLAELVQALTHMRAIAPVAVELGSAWEPPS